MEEEDATRNGRWDGGGEGCTAEQWTGNSDACSMSSSFDCMSVGMSDVAPFMWVRRSILFTGSVRSMDDCDDTSSSSSISGDSIDIDSCSGLMALRASSGQTNRPHTSVARCGRPDALTGRADLGGDDPKSSSGGDMHHMAGLKLEMPIQLPRKTFSKQPEPTDASEGLLRGGLRGLAVAPGSRSLRLDLEATTRRYQPADSPRKTPRQHSLVSVSAMSPLSRSPLKQHLASAKPEPAWNPIDSPRVWNQHVGRFESKYSCC